MTSIERTASRLPALEFDPGMARSASIDSLASLFQSILMENRLTSLMRVWLARLQMPLVRQALAQPTTSSSESNFGIDLVTHLVACAIEQEGSAVPADALEAEIRRLVLMVEKNASGETDICSQAHAQFKAFLSGYPGSEEGWHTSLTRTANRSRWGCALCSIPFCCDTCSTGRRCGWRSVIFYSRCGPRCLLLPPCISVITTRKRWHSSKL